MDETTTGAPLRDEKSDAKFIEWSAGTTTASFDVVALAARIGGDELLVALHGVRDMNDAVSIAEKLRVAASQPVTTPSGPVSTTLSIGVTLAKPDESTDALVARADSAMYRAKQTGRNRVVPFADENVAATT